MAFRWTIWVAGQITHNFQGIISSIYLKGTTAVFIFGEHLKNIRKSKNLTQKQLAAAIGASEGGIQQYELGRRKPTYDMLITLADYFDISLDYLVGRSDDPTRH